MHVGWVPNRNLQGREVLSMQCNHNLRISRTLWWPCMKSEVWLDCWSMSRVWCFHMLYLMTPLDFRITESHKQALLRKSCFGITGPDSTISMTTTGNCKSARGSARVLVHRAIWAKPLTDHSQPPRKPQGPWGSLQDVQENTIALLEVPRKGVMVLQLKGPSCDSGSCKALISPPHVPGCADSACQVYFCFFWVFF